MILFSQRFFTFIVFILFTLRGVCQNNDTSLSKRASSIVLNESISIVVSDIQTASQTIKKKIKILDESASSKLIFTEYIDKFKKIENLKITVFEDDGIQKSAIYSERDIQKEIWGDGLVDEGFLYYFQIPHHHYPITYEISYVKKFKGLLNYPSYHFIHPNEEVKESIFTISVPSELDIYYKAYQTNIEPTRIVTKNQIQYTWQVTNLDPIWNEKGSAEFYSISPRIEISPSKFKLDGYEGSMSSWIEFSKWYASLALGENVIPIELKKELKLLVASETNEINKAKKIYEYLQSNYRYVLIALGIGGYKPYAASKTYQTKYGDCKALSNFMQASLREVGIKSYQCLINAAYNELPIDTTFPHNHFNHVILCIPQNKDTIWLECTSSENEFGFLGSFTENRYALLTDELEGKLVQTPKSNPQNNNLNSHSIIALKEDGSASIATKLNVTGDFVSRFKYFLLESDENQKLEYLINYLKYKQADITTFDTISEFKKTSFSFETQFSKLPNIITNEKMFLDISILDLIGMNLTKYTNRKTEFCIEFPNCKKDTTEYLLPAGSKPTLHNINYTSDSEFFNYESSYIMDTDKNSLSIISSLTTKKHRINANEYDAFYLDYQKIQEHRNRKIILLR